MAIDPGTTVGARALERLATDRILWLTSVTPDGQPQSMPVWFLWTDGEILVYSQQGAVRNRSIAANPRVSAVLADDGAGGNFVSIDGEARIDDAYPQGKDNPAYLVKYGDWLVDYGWTPAYFSDRYNVPVRIRPTRLRGAL